MTLQIGDQVVNQYGIEGTVALSHTDEAPLSIIHNSGIRYDVVFNNGTSPHSTMIWKKFSEELDKIQSTV